MLMKGSIIMAMVTTRIDDETKSEAEAVANEIGINLSTAISVFLRQFIANQGFPFEVVVPGKTRNKPIVNVRELDEAVKRAIINTSGSGASPIFTYLDPETNKLRTIKKE